MGTEFVYVNVKNDAWMNKLIRNNLRVTKRDVLKKVVELGFEFLQEQPELVFKV